MDTRDQALTKLTRLHDESHPTPHRPASLRRNYSLLVGSNMELAMEKGWWWRRPKIPLSGAPNGLQIWPPDEEQEVAAASYRKTRWNFLSHFFSPKIGIYSAGIRVSGAMRWAKPTRARPGGLPRPGGCCSPWASSSLDFGSNNSHIFWNNSPKSFVPFWELLFLHKNNTMVVVLKTTLVRVSFIQIMQI